MLSLGPGVAQGSMSSLWQQAGRGGRGDRDSLAVLICLDSPMDQVPSRPAAAIPMDIPYCSCKLTRVRLDQSFAARPSLLFDKPFESATADPYNSLILAGHLTAAAFELPLEADEAGLDSAVGETAMLLALPLPIPIETSAEGRGGCSRMMTALSPSLLKHLLKGEEGAAE